MKKIVLFTILLFLINPKCYSNQYFNFIVPQSIFISGEKVHFMVNDLPYYDNNLFIYMSLYDFNGKEITTNYFKLKNNEKFISNFTLPNNLSSGSYFLSAYCYEINSISIHTQSTHLIHIITNESGTTYHRFENKNDNQTHLQKNTLAIPTRSKVEIHNKLNAFYYSIEDAYCKFQSQATYSKNTKQDTCFRLFFNSPLINSQVLAFNPISRKTSKLVNISDNIFSLDFKEKFDVDIIDLIDAYKFTYIKVYNFIPNFVSLNTESIIPFVMDSTSELQYQSTKRIRINQIFDEDKLDAKTELNILTVEADNEYSLSNYMQFENIELFFKEVVIPSKLDNKYNNKQIVLLSGDVKKWFSAPAAIFIDGEIKDYNDLSKRDWSEFSNIRLYRKLKTLRKTYGVLGRNGVIEVFTKKYLTNIEEINSLNFLKNDIEFTNFKNTSQPDFSSLQFISSNKFYHGDDIGKFNVYEIDMESSKINCVLIYSAIKQ